MSGDFEGDADAVSSEGLAELLIVDDRKVRELAKRGIVEKKGRGKYLIAASVKGYIRHLRREAKARQDDPYATHQEVADHLGVDRARITQLVGKGVLPKTGDGKQRGLELDACRFAYLKHLREVAAGRSQDAGDLDLTEERARKTKEEADNVAMQNDVMRGELVSRSDVDDAVQMAWSRVRQKLLAIPSGVAVKLFPDKRGRLKAQELIETGIHGALEELADTRVDELSRTDGELVADTEASTKADSKPVGGSKKKAKR